MALGSILSVGLTKLQLPKKVLKVHRFHNIVKKHIDKLRPRLRQNFYHDWSIDAIFNPVYNRRIGRIKGYPHGIEWKLVKNDAAASSNSSAGFTTSALYNSRSSQTGLSA